jgi:signal transduction histidine kinase
MRQQGELYLFARALNRVLTPHEVCEAALRCVQGCLGVSRAAILLSEPGGTLRVHASHGFSSTYRKALEGASVWENGGRPPAPTCTSNLGTSRTFPAEWRALAQREGGAAMAILPLVHQQKLLGALVIYHGQPHRFTRAEMQLAESVSNQLAFGLKRIWSEEAERRANELLARQTAELERVVSERTASLRETVAELESFSYSIAHDLRAPLRAMQGFTTLLIASCGALSPQSQDFANRITSSADRMDKLIQDVLNYGKVVRGDMPLETVDVKVLLTGILDSYPQVHAGGAEIAVHDAFAPVHANEALLTQCLSNLLSNAVKFVAPKVTPRVRVWSEPAQGMVRILVADNGIGIREEHHSKIFDMFHRVSCQYEGTGIGLAIVKKAVERMGGKVALKSEPRKGSTFWLDLMPAKERNA